MQISVEPKKKGKGKGASVEMGPVNPLEVLVLTDVQQFQDKKRRGNIDIWWLYDDGGMPVMLAHILKSR